MVTGGGKRALIYQASSRITFPKGVENAEANRSFVGVYFTVFSIPYNPHLQVEMVQPPILSPVYPGKICPYVHLS